MFHSHILIFVIAGAVLAEATDQIETDTKEVDEQLKHVFEEMQELKELNKKHTREIQQLSEENTSLKNEVNLMKINTKSTNFIGFFAYHGDNAFYGSGATIMFPNVMTNRGPEGSIYDPATSRFYCGVPGMYYFAVSLLSKDETGIWAAINVGGTQYAQVHAVPTHSGHACSNSAVVYCNNEDVTIIATSSSTVHGSAYSSFTGYLLSMD